MRVWSLLPLLCLLTGCFRDPGADSSASSPLLHSPDAGGVFRIDQAATHPELLRHAVAATHRQTTGKLGAHVFVGTHSMRVTENGKLIENLDETTALEVNRTGDFHLLYENSRDYGREAYFDGDGPTVWIRPRYGKYHRRRPATRDEPARLTNDVYATLAADYELIAHAVNITDLGAINVDGRRARKLKLSLGKARTRAAQKLAHKKWRGRFTVTELSGELVLDIKTGVLLVGKLTSRGQLVKSGHTYQLELRSTHQLTKTPVTLDFPTDEDSVQTPTRSPDVADREKLLRGIAPPMRRRGH